MPEADFLDLCTRCGNCVEHCETRILVTGDGGYPEVNFARGECSFCGACVTHCMDGAIDRRAEHAPWTLRASLDTRSCLATRGVVCAICAEACTVRAIRLETRSVVPAPQLDSSTCTGCGACIAPCPVSALNLHALPTENIPCT